MPPSFRGFSVLSLPVDPRPVADGTWWKGMKRAAPLTPAKKQSLLAFVTTLTPKSMMALSKG